MGNIEHPTFNIEHRTKIQMAAKRHKKRKGKTFNTQHSTFNLPQSGTPGSTPIVIGAG
jgi:hypothetical protein